MKNFIETIIMTGNYVLAEMEERIEKMFILGKLTADNLHFNEAGGARFATYCMDMMNQITPY